VNTVGEFLLEGIRVGQPVLVIARPEHREGFVAYLRERLVDVDQLVHDGLLSLLDAEQTLSRFMSGSTPDPFKFEQVVGSALRTMTRSQIYVVVRAYGEMVDLLWKQGNVSGAIALEDLWNDLAKRHRFDLLCAYEMSNFAHESATDGFTAICGQHGHVAPTESYLHAQESDRLRQIAVLQQRAAALEDAVRERMVLARELEETLARRRSVEDELQRRERELRDFMENGLEPMHWVGAQGTILWANRAELAMLGYAREEYIGRHIAEFHADRAVIDDVLNRLQRGEELRNVPARVRCKDGSTRQVLISSNVYWQDGKFIHTRCFSRDVTDVSLAHAS
jgi:PAS domain S-box-containing protein